MFDKITNPVLIFIGLKISEICSIILFIAFIITAMGLAIGIVLAIILFIGWIAYTPIFWVQFTFWYIAHLIPLIAILIAIALFVGWIMDNVRKAKEISRHRKAVANWSDEV